MAAVELVTTLGPDAGVAAADNVAASNAVLAGIAAADAICGRMLGERSVSENHDDAIALLGSVHGARAHAQTLGRLVAEKTNSQYTPSRLSGTRSRETIERARRLVDAMETYLRENPPL